MLPHWGKHIFPQYVSIFDRCRHPTHRSRLLKPEEDLNDALSRPHRHLWRHAAAVITITMTCTGNHVHHHHHDNNHCRILRHNWSHYHDHPPPHHRRLNILTDEHEGSSLNENPLHAPLYKGAAQFCTYNSTTGTLI